MSKRAIIYARISTEKPTKGYSLQTQVEEHLTYLCGSQDHHLAGSNFASQANHVSRFERWLMIFDPIRP